MPRRVMQGTVVSDKMEKTVVVLVERRVMHPIYKKYLRQSKRYLAHDESNIAKIGDVVRIRECRPLSKRKCWEVLQGTDDVVARDLVATDRDETDGVATDRDGTLTVDAREPGA